MKIMVTYQSKTGFTRKYAEWIAKALSCELRELSKVTASEIAAYDLVIHGGWVMGGMINGFKKIKAYNPRRLIVFAVGFTAGKDIDRAKYIETNALSDTPFFYFEGGMDPGKMGFAGRMMVRLATKKPPVFADHTDITAIRELVELAKRAEP